MLNNSITPALYFKNDYIYIYIHDGIQHSFAWKIINMDV